MKVDDERQLARTSVLGPEDPGMRYPTRQLDFCLELLDVGRHGQFVNGLLGPTLEKCSVLSHCLSNLVRDSHGEWRRHV